MRTHTKVLRFTRLKNNFKKFLQKNRQALRLACIVISSANQKGGGWRIQKEKREGLSECLEQSNTFNIHSLYRMTMLLSANELCSKRMAMFLEGKKNRQLVKYQAACKYISFPSKRGDGKAI